MGAEVRGLLPGRLVGRGREMERATRLLLDAAAGPRGMALVEGEGGIGKTRFLAELAATARSHGFTVLRGGAHELAEHQPFAAIASALAGGGDDVPPERASLARRLRAAGEPPSHLLDELMTLVEAMTLECPALVALDDLQWADGASLEALDYLARHGSALRLAIVGTSRLRPARPEVDRFRRCAERLGALTVSLGPLEEGAVIALLSGLLGAAPGPELAALARRAGGNPLYVEEVARGLHAEAGLRWTGAARRTVAELVTPGLPLPFRRLVLGRLATLPAETVAVLRVASVLGSEFQVADLALVVDQSASELAATLEPALREGVVGPAGDGLAFRHDLVRAAIFEEIPPGIAGALHRQVGQGLARAGAPPAVIAAHLAAGARPGDPEAVAWLERTAREAMHRAPATAVGLLDRALDICGPSHDGHERLLAERAQVLVWTGRAADALAAVGEQLDRGVPPSLEPVLRRTRMLALLLLGRGQEAACDGEHLAGPRGGADRPGLHVADAACGLIMAGDLGRAEALATRAAALAGPAGDPFALSVALSALALVAYFQGRLPESVEWGRRAEEQSLIAEDPEATARPTRIWLSLALADAGRLGEATEQLQRARLSAERAGVSWHLALHHCVMGRMHWLAGDWDDCQAEMRTSISVAAELGFSWVAPQQWSYLAAIALRREDDDGLQQALASAASGYAETGSLLGLEVLAWVQALDLEARGDPAAAAAVLAAAWSALAEVGYLIQFLELGPDLARLALAVEDRDLAGRVCAGVAEAARRACLPSAEATALRCRGLVEGDPRPLLEAVRLLRNGPRRFELALACEDAGRELVRAGRAGEGTPLLDEAAAAFRRVGARRDLRRLLATMRGVVLHRRGGDLTRRPPQRGWAALTGTERRVVQLAAQGLTNAAIGEHLFISRRTVETHLTHVFAKLGVASRVELAAAYARREDAPPLRLAH